jgi:hypothetical protein
MTPISIILTLLLLILSGEAKQPNDSSNNDNDSLENRVPCLDKSFRYRKRPKSLMTVKSQVAILSINSLSSAHMDLSTDVYLIHEWSDERCLWRPLPGLYQEGFKGKNIRITLYIKKNL